MFRLQAGESVAVAIPRVLKEELVGALGWLGGGDRALELRVHEARKCLKRVRALLALGEAGLSSELRRRVTASARAAADALAGLRSTTALSETFEDLLGRYEGELSAEHAEPLRAKLRHGPTDVEDPEAAVRKALAVLQRDYGIVDGLELTHDGWSALEPGFRRTYRRARRAFAALEPGSALDCWHELRIPAKRHGYQLELLEPLWEGPIESLREEVEELGERLGEHHDLSLLAAEFAAHGDIAASAAAAQKLIARRLRKLERDALQLGARVFAERPRRLSRRFARYFHAWQS